MGAVCGICTRNGRAPFRSSRVGSRRYRQLPRWLRKSVTLLMTTLLRCSRHSSGAGSSNSVGPPMSYKIVFADIASSFSSRLVRAVSTMQKHSCARVETCTSSLCMMILRHRGAGAAASTSRTARDAVLLTVSSYQNSRRISTLHRISMSGDRARDSRDARVFTVRATSAKRLSTCPSSSGGRYGRPRLANWTLESRAGAELCTRSWFFT